MDHRYPGAFRDLPQFFPEILLFPRKEPVKGEFPRVSPAHGQGGDSGAASWNRDHLDSSSCACPDHLVPRIGDAGGSGIGHQYRVQVSFEDFRSQRFCFVSLVMPVAADQRCVESENLA